MNFRGGEDSRSYCIFSGLARDSGYRFPATTRSIVIHTQIVSTTTMIEPSTKLRPSPIDGYPTITSVFQDETETVLREYIPNLSYMPKPLLEKRPHMQFLIRNLVQGFPTRYTSQDASQPWLLFWTLQSFSILQVGMDPGNKQRFVISTLCVLSNVDGRKRQVDRQDSNLATPGRRVWWGTWTGGSSTSNVRGSLCDGYRWETGAKWWMGSDQPVSFTSLYQWL